MNEEEIIKNNLLNISIKAMKDNFLSLDDKIKQKEFCKLLDENQQLKEIIKKAKTSLKVKIEALDTEDVMTRYARLELIDILDILNGDDK